MVKKFPIDRLKKWYLENKRSFPWREIEDPYAIYVSEIMLQQTIASVVIPYFKKWLERFPSFEVLSSAKEEEIIKAWEGLGYYSRARNLHEAAKVITRDYNGELPCDPEKLKKIKGVGSYTLGALLNFAFKQKAAAIDGNVERVISRFYGIEEEITKANTKKKIYSLTLQSLPDEEPWIISEALIELGALVCKKVPQCFHCPLQEECLAKTRDMTSQIPRKKVKPASIPLFRSVVCIEADNHFLLKKNEKGKIMADLYEFPFREVNSSIAEEKEETDFWQNLLGVSLNLIKILPIQMHTFTKYKVTLRPFYFQSLSCKQNIDSFEWIRREDLRVLPFSSGHLRILNTLLEKETRLVSSEERF